MSRMPSTPTRGRWATWSTAARIASMLPSTSAAPSSGEEPSAARAASARASRRPPISSSSMHEEVTASAQK
ncbi:hypothetical protein MO973_40365 [Paenibacillus sp. TRM 82003]|nr:hypothetical protein [Paenibacillus sp. TRM 82003]